MLNLKYKILACIAAALVLVAGGYGLGHHNTPTKTVTVTKVETQVQTKTVDHVIYQDRVIHDLQTNTKTVVQWKTNPDGTKTTTETVTAHNQEQDTTDTKAAEDKQTDQKVNTVTFTKSVTSYSRANYSIGLNASFNKLSLTPGAYGIEISRRLLGPISLTIGGNTHKELTAGIRFEF